MAGTGRCRRCARSHGVGPCLQGPAGQAGLQVPPWGTRNAAGCWEPAGSQPLGCVSTGRGCRAGPPQPFGSSYKGAVPPRALAGGCGVVVGSFPAQGAAGAFTPPPQPFAVTVQCPGHRQVLQTPPGEASGQQALLPALLPPGSALSEPGTSAWPRGHVLATPLEERGLGHSRARAGSRGHGEPAGLEAARAEWAAN